MSTKNDKKKGEFIGALAEYGTISAACDKLGIGYWVYRRWYESDEEFARSVDECADRRIDTWRASSWSASTPVTSPPSFSS